MVRETLKLHLFLLSLTGEKLLDELVNVNKEGELGLSDSCSLLIMSQAI